MDWDKRFRQQAEWTRLLRAYLFDKTGLVDAQRVLEVGCGTGVLLAGLPTRAAVHGLDLDPDRLAEARQHAPTAWLARGDALCLPYHSAIFDITFCHFLLLWVLNPLQAMHEMRRVTRPGGCVLALAEPDDSGRIDLPKALEPLGRWQAESLRRQGADPNLGRRLGELFAGAGITVIETGCLSKCETHSLMRGEWQMEWGVLEADLAGVVPDEELKRIKKLDEEAWMSGERVLYVPTHYAWGRL